MIFTQDLKNIYISYDDIYISSYSIDIIYKQNNNDLLTIY